MKRSQPRSLTRTHFRYFVTVILFIIAVAGIYWALIAYVHLTTDLERMDENYKATRRDQIRREITRLADYILYEKSRSETRLKHNLRQRVEHLHTIATQLYEQARPFMSNQQIEQMLQRIIRPLRLGEDRKGYYFAWSLDGRARVYPPNPAIEGFPLDHDPHPERAPTIRQLIEIARDHGQGFLTYDWTSDSSVQPPSPKLAYVKYFRPLDWFIAAGEHLDDFEENIQSHILDRIERIRLGKSGYVFVLDYQGNLISHINPNLVGRNLMDYQDEVGNFVLRKLIKVARSGGGFARYHWPRPGLEEATPKMSYATAIDDWQWVIGTGVYMEDIQERLAIMRSQYQDTMLRGLLFHTLLLVLLAFLFALLVSRKFSTWISGEFAVFNRFFKNALERGHRIRPEHLRFAEFQSLARSASEMVDKQRRAETALRNSEQRFRAIFAHAPVGILLLDPNQRILQANEALCNLLGYSEDQLKTMHMRDLIHPEDAPETIKLLYRLGSGRIPRYQTETRPICKDGHEMHALLTATLMRDEHDRPADCLVQVLNITERKQAEINLRRSRRELSINHSIATIFLTAPEHETYHDVLDVVLDALESPYGYFGYLTTPNVLVCSAIRWDSRPEAPPTTGFSVRLERTQWDNLWGQSLIEGRTLHSNEHPGAPPGWIEPWCALAVPIIHQDELLGQFLVANKPSGYHAEDARLLGSIANQTAPVLRARLDAEQHAHQRRAAEDERAHLENHLRQAQKLEAIGTLAGGIAHDFNNILSGLLGYSELALLDTPPDSKAHACLQEIYAAADRATQLVRQILTFSRRTAHERRPLEVQSVLGEALKLLRGSFPATIEIRQHIDPHCRPILADPTEIHQVIMNLGTNAYHAMRETGGVLDVNLDQLDLEPETIRENGQLMNLEPGPYICLAFRDTGHGMDTATLERIFEPYFTTKTGGEGSGMGLATVHGIVKDCQGAVTVTSQPGSGTTFRVYLPLCEGRFQPDLKATRQLLHPPAGSERILFVDDEFMIANLTREALERFGYQITTCTNGSEAIQTFQQTPHAFDVVVTDQIMPHLTGIELARQIHRTRPDIPIILCSGFSQTVNKHTADEAGIREYVMKPVVASELAQVIRKVLDHDSPPMDASSPPEQPS